MLECATLNYDQLFLIRNCRGLDVQNRGNTIWGNQWIALCAIMKVPKWKEGRYCIFVTAFLFLGGGKSDTKKKNRF